MNTFLNKNSAIYSMFMFLIATKKTNANDMINIVCRSTRSEPDL